MALFKFLPAILAVMMGLTHACREPVAGKDTGAQTLQERAKVPDNIVYGKVISVQLPIVSGNASKEYKVHVEPLCWLQRGPRSPSPNDGLETTDADGGQTGGEGATDPRPIDRNAIADGDSGFNNITVVEYKHDCVANDLKKDAEYVIFLSKQGAGLYRVDDVNEEPGALKEPGDADFKAVYRGVNAGTAGDLEGECQEGVDIPCFVWDDDREGCNKGVALGVAVWSMVLTAAVAVSAY